MIYPVNIVSKEFADELTDMAMSAVTDLHRCDEADSDNEQLAFPTE